MQTTAILSIIFCSILVSFILGYMYGSEKNRELNSSNVEGQPCSYSIKSYPEFEVTEVKSVFADNKACEEVVKHTLINSFSSGKEEKNFHCDYYTLYTDKNSQCKVGDKLTLTLKKA